jgi:hypothetical protein
LGAKTGLSLCSLGYTERNHFKKQTNKNSLCSLSFIEEKEIDLGLDKYIDLGRYKQG